MGKDSIIERSSPGATQAHHVGSSSKEDRSLPAGEMGEGEAEEGGVELDWTV